MMNKKSTGYKISYNERYVIWKNCGYIIRDNLTGEEKKCQKIRDLIYYINSLNISPKEIHIPGCVSKKEKNSLLERIKF